MNDPDIEKHVNELLLCQSRQNDINNKQAEINIEATQLILAWRDNWTNCRRGLANLKMEIKDDVANPA